MLRELTKALPLLVRANKHIKRALSHFRYPIMHESLDNLIRDIQQLIDALRKGERVRR